MRLAALLLALSLLPSSARADTPVRPKLVEPGSRRVALFPISGGMPLSLRLAAELAAQGFEVVNAAAPASESASFPELQAEMARTRSGLAVRIALEPTLLRLWIVNAATHKEQYREVVVTAGSEPDSAIAALWAVEALRASELPALPTPIPEAPAPARRPREPAPSPPRHALQLAPAVALSPGGLSPSFQAALSARQLLAKRVGLELWLALPTLPARLERPSGRARVWRGMTAVGPFLTTGDAEIRAALDVAAGAALLLTRVEGSASAGFAAREEQLVSFGPYARVGGITPLASCLRLRLDAALGVAFPRPVVFFAEQRAAAWGRPWFLLSLGAEVAF